MGARIDLPGLGLRFRIPVYLVQGEEDLVTVPAVARAYFDSIRAPRKRFHLLAATGHDPNAAMVDAQYQILTTQILPRIRYPLLTFCSFVVENIALCFAMEPA